MKPFDLLRASTTLHSGDTLYYTLVDDWCAKREIVAVMCEDLPALMTAYENSQSVPYENDARYSIPDRVPEVRLKAAVESTVNALYGLADVAANFGSKATNSLPSSFNTLAKKIAAENVEDVVANALEDLSWYQRVREIRTEWAHHSSVFVGRNDKDETIFVVRDYRRPSDKVHFTETVHVTAAELVSWTHNAISGIDAYAGYLAENHVLPKFPPDKVIVSDVRDEYGFPKMKEDGSFVTQKITIRQHFRNRGIDLDSYINKAI